MMEHNTKMICSHLLKNKYLFHDETNKEILYDDEINMFAETYNVIDACPILA